MNENKTVKEYSEQLSLYQKWRLKKAEQIALYTKLAVVDGAKNAPAEQDFNTYRKNNNNYSIEDIFKLPMYVYFVMCALILIAGIILEKCTGLIPIAILCALTAAPMKYRVSEDSKWFPALSLIGIYLSFAIIAEYELPIGNLETSIKSVAVLYLIVTAVIVLCPLEGIIHIFKYSKYIKGLREEYNELMKTAEAILSIDVNEVKNAFIKSLNESDQIAYAIGASENEFKELRKNASELLSSGKDMEFFDDIIANVGGEQAIVIKAYIASRPDPIIEAGLALSKEGSEKKRSHLFNYYLNFNMLDQGLGEPNEYGKEYFQKELSEHFKEITVLYE